MLGICQEFPSFELKAVDGNNNFIDVTNQDLDGKWSVVYFYPKDFTFICPTEIAAMDSLLEEAAVLGISGDNEFCKLNWKQTNDLIANINHPLAGDCGCELAAECGVYNDVEGVAFRATFILNPEGIIQSVSCNELDTGRSATEILRTVQALKAGGLTGCSWNPGEEFVA